MALYKDAQYVKLSDGKEFSNTTRPGEAAPFSGIYVCKGCSREIASNKGEPMPPQNHHQHSSTEIPILWTLIVRTNS